MYPSSPSTYLPYVGGVPARAQVGIPTCLDIPDKRARTRSGVHLNEGFRFEDKGFSKKASGKSGWDSNLSLLPQDPK